MPPAGESPADGRDLVAALTDVLCRALRQLADAGEVDAACRLAAEGWSLLWRDRVREAERLNGMLHALVRRLPPEPGSSESIASRERG